MCEGELCIYIFGYGSLMWRPGFPYLRKFDGYIKGWKRVFWQGSTDHRGTPSSPGRVVTLTRQKPDSAEQYKTWGVVYCIPEAEVTAVLKGLDYREKGGYVREEVDVYISGSETPVVSSAIIYLADETNEEYLGEAPPMHIASQIFNSVGPSGPNIDYLLNLATVLRSMNVMDEHVFELEEHVRILMNRTGTPDMITTTTTTTTTTIECGADTQTVVEKTVSISVDEAETLSADPCEQDSTHQKVRTRSGSDGRGQLQRKYLSGCASKGIIIVDNGAMTAVSNRGKSLLAAGIIGIQGTFLPHDLVNITDMCGRVVARGYPSYGSEEIIKIKGKHSAQIVEFLGFDRGEAVVINQNMILV